MKQAQLSLESKIKAVVRDIPDFPKPGIIFKDLTPLLKMPDLSKEIIAKAAADLAPFKPEALVCLESRGFWYGLSIAIELGIPMIPIRKQGKLPYKVMAQEYDLEYGSAKVEIHIDALHPGMRVAIHDDLLATGGTALAATKLIAQQGATVCAYSFLVELGFLGGRARLEKHCEAVLPVVKY